MEKNYYISGYTGFCPDMAHRIGQNYTESTRDALRVQPHLRGRLGATRWHEMQKGTNTHQNRDGFECAYDAIPNCASGYTGHIPTHLWTSCKRDDQRCPLKAYSLSCSEYGSSCLDNSCNDRYGMCSRQGYDCDDKIFLNVPHGDYHLKENRSSKSCCFSCSKGGQCEAERRSHYPASNQSSKACCNSCSKGGSCESGQRNIYKLPKQASKACCNSCSQGGACESTQRNLYQSAKQPSRASYSSCSSGESNENSRRSGSSRPPCCRFKFQEMELKPYRKCGVIPNYMGYIPGMQNTFGEPYGITANRLLKRHFSEQDNRHF